MKISEVTYEDVKNFIRIDDISGIEEKEIKTMMKSALEYIKSYTGLSDLQLDNYEDITHAFFILVVDMFDNRNLYIEGKASNINKSVECILNMHSTNLL